MKIAITGKGGVGKTTLAGLLARLLADCGETVLAIDADPDANFGSAIGISPEQLASTMPISKMKELATQRTGAEGDGMFSLTPHVADIPDTYSIEHKGIKLLLLGTVEQGGGGCICPEHALVRTLMKHILFKKGESVIMDMEAGIEHLGRGTADSVDALITVVEPGSRSLQTARMIRELAADIGLKKTFVVASKVRNQEEKDYLRANLPDGELLGIMPLSEDVRQADMQNIAPYDLQGDIVESARDILKKLREKLD
ncbi:AAA family ATPase [Desulfobaculum bizertense]|uniref:CO dehydrogenase maturation factor n=1 Tax=Desulfobaculum bizertense DSM 18034 TaxID=1121442 RepID=A0A1T4VS61_9BACT|nr:AAA family ATPase [Desulfobaculum bizertense]SKA67800.1 CO dehydrogenase maturation factor [Desulfobaculum bizertense DSM 18034]